MQVWEYASEISCAYNPTLSILPRFAIYVLLVVTLIYLINAYRKRNSRIIARLSIFAGVVFLSRLIIVCPSVIITTDALGIYLLLSTTESILFSMTLFYLYIYVTSNEFKELTNIELITEMVQFISIIFLLLSTIRGFSAFFIVSGYLGFALLLIGGFTYYESKHHICISFITWGIFILILIIYRQHIFENYAQ
jgi:hypothetical protein